MPIIGYHYIIDPKRAQFMLHGPSMSEFCQQLDSLDPEKVLTLDELVARKHAGKSLDGYTSMIFDDGMMDHYFAAKELHKRGMKGTFFPIACVFDGTVPVTIQMHIVLSKIPSHDIANALEAYIQQHHQATHAGFAVPRDKRINNKRLYDDVVTANLKQRIAELPLSIKEAFVAKQFSSIVPDTSAFCREFFMQPEQLKELKAMGMEIGSHSYSHSSLKSMTQEEQMNDLSRAKKLIEQHIDGPIATFSYPFGDYNHDTQHLLKELGFTKGVVFNHSSVSVHDDDMLLSVYDCKDVYEYHSAKRVLGIIPARGGSKGFPRKNIAILAGKPLIAHSIDAAKQSAFITDCIVSTDDHEIAAIAKQYGAHVPFIRPEHLAADETPMVPVVQHAVTHMEEDRGEPYDIIVLLQPTSPLKTAEDIDGAIQKLISSQADNVYSVVPLTENTYHPLRVKTLGDGDKVFPFGKRETEGVRRQDMPKVYRRNGAIFSFTRDLIMNQDSIFGTHESDTRAYIMSEESSIDIDSEYDKIKAEYMLARTSNNMEKETPSNTDTQDFDTKWTDIRQAEDDEKADERSLFVDIGDEPKTQRQLNLYYYFQFIKNHFEKQQVTRAIEVGCGRGTIALYLAKYLGVEMTLLDNQKDAIALAQHAFAEHGLSASFMVGDAVHTDIADNSYDAVVSIGLAEHFESVDALYAEQYRILKPGGLMISLNIPKKRSVQYLNTIMRSIKKLLGKYHASVTHDYYRNTLKPEAYAQAAKTAGFTDIALTNVCPFPIYTPIKKSTDEKITVLNKMIIRLRSLFMTYPYKTNYHVSQAHFLVAYKQ